MDWTDRHCRFFLRLLSKHALLYTEMVTTGALLHGDAERFLRHDVAEHPLALQLTNIIRDVGDDARRGRIYLPVSELQQFDVKAQEILKRDAPWGYSDRFSALMRFQAERAHRLYDEAFALLPEADRRAQKPGLMMANIYRTLLREIEADGYQVLHQRTSLTPLRKLWIAWRTHWRGR